MSAGVRAPLSLWSLCLSVTYTRFLSLSPPDDLPKKRPAQIYKPSNPETLAYLDFSVSTTGMLAGVKVGTLVKAALLAVLRGWQVVAPNL